MGSSWCACVLLLVHLPLTHCQAATSRAANTGWRGVGITAQQPWPGNGGIEQSMPLGRPLPFHFRFNSKTCIACCHPALPAVSLK